MVEVVKFIRYTVWVLRRKTEKSFYLSPSCCALLKGRASTLIFKHCWGYSAWKKPNFWWKYKVSKVLGYMGSRVRGTWVREHRVHGFRGTGLQGTGYIVSHYPLTYSSLSTTNQWHRHDTPTVTEWQSSVQNTILAQLLSVMANSCIILTSIIARMTSPNSSNVGWDEFGDSECE